MRGKSGIIGAIRRVSEKYFDPNVFPLMMDWFAWILPQSGHL